MQSKLSEHLVTFRDTLMGGAERTFACKSQECLWQGGYISDFNFCRYNLRSRTRCEDDHGLCTDVIVEFTLDHARLPVSQLTMERFHTKNE